MDLDHYGLDFVIWIFYPPLVATMQGEFEMSMMGELSFFLGLLVKQTKDEIFLCQSKYCKEILKKFEMESCKEASTPMPSSCYMDADAAGYWKIKRFYG